MSFGALLRSLRQSAGLSQEELAERAGLTSHGVSALERGIRARPHPRTVRALGDALGVAEPQRQLLVEAARPRTAVDRAPDGDRTATVHPPPAPPTALVGRDRELTDLAALLRRREVRLVTVTGTGGVGKTRLVIEAARVAADAFPDGVAFVALAPVSDPGLVLPTVAAALGVTGGGTSSAGADVAARLRERRVLLVLDNFEHVMAAAVSVAEIVAACPSVTVLVSSRARLRLRAEVEVPLEPLALPPSGPTAGVDDVRRAAACLLLTERVRAVDTRFGVTAANAASLSEICRRLGGVPLALELAAPRVRTLGPDLLLERLDQTQGWEGPRDLPARQQTMASTLAWSHGLLAEPEQALFRRLSVFAGGCALEAAEAVGSEVVPGHHVLEVLDSLVEQSLVVVAPEERGVRYSLLEPVRQYARSLLHHVGELDSAHRAHAAHFHDLARRAEQEFTRSDQLRWLDRADRETDNFQTAITWSLAVDDGDTAAGLAWSLRLHWWMRGLLAEVSRWMDEALTRGLSPSARTRALLAKAKMAHGQGDFASAQQLFAEATQEARRHGDLPAVVHGTTLHGLVAIDAGDPARAVMRLTDAVSLAGELGDEVLSAMAAIWLGSVLLAQGSTESARPLLEHGMASARRRGDRVTMNEIVLNQASAAVLQGEDGKAASLLKESATLSLQTQDRPNLAFALEGLAVVESRRGAWERSVVLLGAAQGLRSAVGGRYYNYYVPDRTLVRVAEERARSALGGDAFAMLLAEGAAMDAQVAERYATT